MPQPPLKCGATAARTRRTSDPKEQTKEKEVKPLGRKRLMKESIAVARVG